MILVVIVLMMMVVMNGAVSIDVVDNFQTSFRVL